ncbi:MAG: TetR/AcrR family transcriptional regulator [Patulibacter sp.]
MSGERRIPVQDRAIATVEAIVEAAAQTFERLGYEQTTTNRVADRAGVSIGSLYQYFPNKDALLLALIEDHLDDAAARLQPVLGALLRDPPPVAEGIDRLLRVTVELHAARPALHRVLLDDAPRPVGLRDRLARDEQAITAAVRQYLASCPEVTAPDLAAAAALIVRTTEAAIHGVVVRPSDEVSTAVAVGELRRMLLAYLTG